MKLLLIAGARPNFMKIAPLLHGLRRRDNESQDVKHKPTWKLIHTGQHYDYEMSKVFFDELGISEPDYFLNAGSGTHAEQTGRIMVEFEKVCLEENPDVEVVVGDVNSTLACGVTAKKLGVKVAHVEAGLRSRDMTMPEEINRIVTDSIADFLFVTEKIGIDNLKREGRSDDHIYFVGNVMIDTLYDQLDRLNNGFVAHHDGWQTKSGRYAVVTLHRPSNVDHKSTLGGIVEALCQISDDMPVVFPAHPRTTKNLREFGLIERLKQSDVKVVDPMPYTAFLALWKDSSLVLTDSGGCRKKPPLLGFPVLRYERTLSGP